MARLLRNTMPLDERFARTGKRKAFGLCVTSSLMILSQTSISCAKGRYSTKGPAYKHQILQILFHARRSDSNEDVEKGVCWSFLMADKIFTATLYVSENDRVMRYTDEGELTELCKWSVDLSSLPVFQQNARVMQSGFFTGKLNAIRDHERVSHQRLRLWAWTGTR